MPRRIGAWLRPYRGASFAVLGLILVQVGFALVVPFGYQVIFDRVLVQKDLVALAWVMTGLLAAFLVYSVATVLQEAVAARTGTRVMNDLRLRMFEQLQRLGVPFDARHDAGAVVSRFATDLTVIETGIVRPLPLCLLNVLILAASALLLFWVEWRLALFTYAALPLGVVAPRLLGPRATSHTRDRQAEDGRVVSVVQESVAARAIVTAFGLQRARVELFRRRLGALAGASDAASFWSGMAGRGASLGVILVQLMVVGVGAWLAIRGHLSAGALVSFVALLLNVGTSVTPLTRLVPPLIHATGSLQRIEEFLAERPAVSERPDALSLPPLSREIRFEGVGLGDGPQAVLRDLTFSIPAGASVAFVGASGSGKSTVLRLLMRLQDPTEGRVTFDGHDLRQATDASLRAQLGVVLQDTALFNATLGDNIRVTRPDAADHEVQAAARLAQVHDAILGFPAGYDTPVGEGGGGLSGGQRQRVAIARALLRDPPVLVLDEATSALDPATAAAVEGTLRRLEEGRTVVTVTHRLASVAHVDRTFVLDGGRLVEQGSHDELLERKGAYSRLWDKQSGFNVEGDGGQARVQSARLRGVPLLAGLPNALLDELAEQFATERFDAGRVVFVQGDPGDKLYLVVRGSVEVLQASGSGASSVVRVLEDGDYFGELALLDGAPRSGTVRTRTPCLFLTLVRQHFNRLLGTAPGLRADLERAAAERRASTPA
jgi:ATP-binding cassette subfamily B protein